MHEPGGGQLLGAIRAHEDTQLNRMKEQWMLRQDEALMREETVALRQRAR